MPCLNASDYLSNYNIEIIDNKLGLPSIEIRRIIQDRNGFMWFASTNGLFRYDGHEFKTYQTTKPYSKALLSNHILSITDDNTKLWVGTNNGLNYIDKQTQKLHKISSRALANTHINKIVSVDSLIYLATNKGFYKYDVGLDSVYKYSITRNNKQLSTYDVKDVYLDSKNRLWCAIKNMGLFRYDYNRNEFIPYIFSNQKDPAHVIYEDTNHNLWVGSWKSGLTLLTNVDSPSTVKFKTFRHDPKNQNTISSNTIFSITQDAQDGSLWIGHIDGLSILKPPFERGHFINCKYDGTGDNISSNDVSATYCDNNGIMWLGTMGGGVNKLNVKSTGLEYNPLEYISKKYNSRYVTATYLDPNNILWIGIKNQGLIFYDIEKNEYKHSWEIKALRGLPTETKITTILPVMNKQEVWLGLLGDGLIRIEIDSSGTPLKYRQLLAYQTNLINNDLIHSIYTDSQNRIWIGTGKGISVISEKGKLITANTLRGANGNSRIQSFSEDNNGNIWIGTLSNGVYKVRLNDAKLHIEQYSKEKKQIQSNNVLSIFVDNDNNIWAGTKNTGLNLFNPTANKFENVNNQYKIPFNDIFNIFQDNAQTLWMCSDNALINLIPSKNEANIYKASTGLWDNVFNVRCKVLDLGNDRYLLGGLKGYNILNPRSLKINDKISSLAITDIIIDGISIFEQDSDCRFNDFNLTLNHDQNNFAIGFVALNYINPSPNSYAYRLIGYNDQWTYVTGDQRKMNFTNINKGNYTFQVMATNENGVWGEQSLDINITILPSPFQTWWAYLIYCILLSSGIITVYIIISNRIKLKQQINIAEAEKNNLEELHRAKLMFYTNISHELLTPLTIIECATEELKVHNEKNTKPINIISNNVNRLVRLITQMLEFRKAENYKLKLHVKRGNLHEFIKEICDKNFRFLAEKKQIRLQINSTSEGIYGWFDSDKIDKIIYNLLSNATKYNYDNSFIDINISEAVENHIKVAIISVEDGGIGIKPQDIKHIYDRFYTGGTDKKGALSGNGIGLSLSKNLVEVHKGRISVESTIGKGTKFTLMIPLDKEAYDQDQILNGDIQDMEIEEAGFNTISKRENTILIVEDNVELRTIMSEYLMKIYTVHSAENGEEAINLLKEIRFDLIVSDIVMPIKNGFELCQFVKSNISYSHIPVILLTAKTTEINKDNSYNCGADAFITKPFRLNLLITRIDNLIKGRELLKENFEKSDNHFTLSSIAFTSLDEKLLQKAIDIVEDNIDNEDFKFDTFVSEMGISKSMLYRKIKSLTGMTTSDFIKDIRMKYACRLLKSKPISIAEVAYAVGFSQPKYFTVCFHKKYNMTPTQYMNQIKDQT